MRMRPFAVSSVACTLVAVSVTPVFAEAFTDVLKETPYSEAIIDLQQDELLGGYADGSFRPYRTLNRAEFVKLLVQAKIDPHGEKCKEMDGKPFSDVQRSAWFARSVCAAKEAGVVTGFDDGTFRPAKAITLAEASKMLTTAFGQEVPQDEEPWFKSSLATLVEDGAVPPSLGNPDQELMRGEFAEMLWRLREGKKDLACPPLDSLLSSQCQYIDEGSVRSVDMQEVQRMWLQWNNDLRADLGLPAYGLDRQLERTALLWSLQAADKGTITHKRAGQTAYYDYPRMVSWFSSEGLEFENRSSTTFTENIGWGVYSCDAVDCTDELIKAVRTTFDFFLSEKGKASRPHYNSLVNAEFRSIGVGIAVDPASGKYYLTVHYGTEIASAPQPVCL